MLFFIGLERINSSIYTMMHFCGLMELYCRVEAIIPVGVLEKETTFDHLPTLLTKIAS